tara:strand:- start:423 stop:653 length:231 start_codon:yes stop_codon:yes gene_type:complete
MTKKIDKPKLVLHFKSGNHIYRYVLVDRFKHDNKNHYGFDTKQELTEAEIFALVTPRKLRRKYITKKEENGKSNKD